MAQYTPMIQQYLQVKAEAQDAFLFFRLGDFYEMFFDDAINAARELEITLTARNGGTEDKIPMCGVPYHSADNYIQRLIEKGYKVAICEQMEDPTVTKGMVRREIVRVITPGTVMEGKTLGDKSNNYMVCLTGNANTLALAACDLSTGELYVTSVPYSAEWLKDEIGIYEPSEFVGDAALLDVVAAQSSPIGRPVVYTPWVKSKGDLVRQQFGEAVWARLEPERQECIARLFSYLSETQKRSLGQLTQISTYEPEHYMILDPFTRRNLELVETVRERSKKGSLLWLLDRTETSMGARMLRRWVDKPLLQKGKINERLEAVDTLYNQFILREDLRAELKDIYDLERLVGRIAFGNANGRDLNALKQSLYKVPRLRQHCADSPSVTLQQIAQVMDDCEDLRDIIGQAIEDEPPVSVRDGGLIRAGYHERLDELREASVNGKQWIAELEAREREATGIRSLKIGYNKVFGYYIEITKSNLAALPEGRYERKQTLANAERYITPELKEKETLILEAQDKMVDIEYALFTELRDKLNLEIARLQKLAEQVAEIDVYQSFAAISAERSFVKPTITDGYNLVVEQGRHPVVEAVMRDGAFIANQTAMKKDEARILLITGPNMAGKSTYMRQVALISILAQIGCFVPAGQAEVPIMDRIFTRIGAADDLIGGQSTFMVEMADIQVMTEKATPRSLIIIDELGRGTSTSEGMAIAQSVIEYVHDVIGCKALVSTHFHELAHLEESLDKLANYSMAVQESGDKVNFLRKLIAGAASSSYGIYCARLAGLPDSIIDRANGLLHGFEHAAAQVAVGSETVVKLSEREVFSREDTARIDTSSIIREENVSLEPNEPIEQSNQRAEQEIRKGNKGQSSHKSPEVVQLSIFGDEEPSTTQVPVVQEMDQSTKEFIHHMKDIDVMNMTPLQAMQVLNELKLKAQQLS
ncbi:DNA mismatch repair protein MutS [Paenibacillus sp. Root52]|uniref:DNA mismatch repair protein MutS n=1 Tax=Paenibacillus amylolyticus TaxID=1451 RepID=A0AAP5GWR6_PAEAM|nr:MULTISPECIES: DNA mismatch repair protein MutS [Paenibacillus]KQY94088.1 DNA mismatch repair protein MutS [Paenibacillus sp. Root52]MDR6721944.1 DNA mismatch repair protein MutS [Paenibacillus amylolyticus]